LTATTVGVVVGIAALALPTPAIPLAGPVEAGRFVWQDLLTKDVNAARRFYGGLLGWRFDSVTRNGRPYVLARTTAGLVGGIVDISAMPDAGAQWLSFLSVDDVDHAVALVGLAGGKTLVGATDFPIARAAAVTDPQGAPLGLVQVRRPIPDSAQPTANHFFWHEYLARDAPQALAFYRSLAGFDSTILESRFGIDYHVLRTTRGRAGLFKLPETADVEPNWLPYVLAADPAALAARVPGLGGRILLPAAQERRNGSVVVIADPDGAPLALQKYPY
jgi:predicted enzyme related to lactoylglutathione lyase